MTPPSNKSFRCSKQVQNACCFSPTLFMAMMTASASFGVQVPLGVFATTALLQAYSISVVAGVAFPFTGIVNSGAAQFMPEKNRAA